MDPCGEPCRAAQKAWLAADLKAANANRDAVPWIVVQSHYPFYCTGCVGKQLPARYYASSVAERFGNDNLSAAEAWIGLPESSWTHPGAHARQRTANPTIQQSSHASISDLMSILTTGKVDMYVAGHWHYYESLWPAEPGSTGAGGKNPVRSFDNPKWPVHVTSGERALGEVLWDKLLTPCSLLGNGGPPSVRVLSKNLP